MTDDAQPTDPQPRTEILLARHYAGEPQALGNLLQRELPSIRAQIHHQLGGVVRKHMDTGDVVQEVCVHVLCKGPRLPVVDAEQFRRLMARLVRNKLVELARRYGADKRDGERRYVDESEFYRQSDAPRADTATPSRIAADHEESQLIALGLALLDPLDREVLRQHDELAAPFTAIAVRLGISADAVRMRYKRAVPRLHECVTRLRRGDLRALLADLEQDSGE